MKWETVKSAKDVVLEGLSFEIDKTDSSLNSVTISDAAGNQFRVRMSSYSMYLEVPAKPKMVEKFAVKGSVLGLDVNEQFDNEYEAGKRKEELDGAYGASIDVCKALVPDEIPF